MNTLHINSNTVFNPLEDCPYTVQEVCEIERLSPAKVRAMCQSGELPGAYKASNASGWRIPRQALDAYRQAHQHKPAGPGRIAPRSKESARRRAKQRNKK